MARPREETRHLALVVSLLFFFIIAPIVVVLRHGVLIMNVVAAAVLVAATYALSPRKQLFASAIILSAISIIASGLLLVWPGRWLTIFSHCWIALLIIFFCIALLGYVLSGTRVTMDKIFAAISIYLLFGYAWAFAYAVVEELQPNAFVALTSVSPNDYVAHVLEMRYFSFVTLTTVGYGDIVPHSTAARTLAALEAVTGQIYLTVLVARLVGLYIAHANGASSRQG